MSNYQQPGEFVAHLAAERIRQDFSVAAVSRRTPYCARTIRRWESGETVPNLVQAAVYATVLGLTFTLRSDSPPRTPHPEGDTA